MHKEEYIRDYKILDKSEVEENNDIIMSILKTKMELNNNIKNYEFAEPEQIDYYLYQMKANQAKLDFLIKMAKEHNVELKAVNMERRNIWM